MNTSKLKSLVEALLFASDRPLTLDLLVKVIPESDRSSIRQVLQELIEESRGRGILLVEVAEGYQFRTDPEHAEWIKKLFELRPARLTRAALETLAIIAYRQPITRIEIEGIRGVDSGGVLHTLLERSLIDIVGKKDVPGRPSLYGTTRAFLEHFHLKDLAGLPPLKGIEELKLSKSTEEVIEKLQQPDPENPSSSDVPSDVSTA